MQHENFSKITEIILTGFQNSQSLNYFYFLLLLIIFCVTVCGNLLIILVVAYSRLLHSPMYFFLTQLSFLDILLSTTIVPNLLRILFHEGGFVSFFGCLTQYHFFLASESLECLLLTMMSYDRYQAICNPLHYNSIMDLTFCIKAILLCYLIMLVVILIFSVTMSHLDFCGPNIIDHFFCDFNPVLALSCSDTYLINIEGIVVCVPIVVCPFTLIIVSYVYIIATVMKIPSVTGRQKTFSTCSSHLSVVSLYYGSLIASYLFPNEKSAKKTFSLFYTVITPLLNPIIYSLSNRHIKEALKRLFLKMCLAFKFCWLYDLSILSVE